LGNGLSTRFWHDCWFGDSPLCDRFPRLFLISMVKDGLVGDVWRDRERLCSGGWGWRRRLFVWEETLLGELREVLPELHLSEEEDEWRWEREGSGVFSVKSAYLLLGSVFDQASILTGPVLRVLSSMWKAPAPSKVLAFAWKLLRNRIPTRANLAYRGIAVNGGVVSCVHCHGLEETVSHLFLSCDFADKVWKAIFRWLGLVIILPPNLSMLFECFTGAAGHKNLRRGYSLIWLATVWSIWRSRNNIIFSNGVVESDGVIEAIKLLSWRWGISRHKIPICLFYEWCWDPGLCLRC
jgi:hypothetical protein